MDLLRQAAIDAGADTAFSAAEAAKGIDELAKAGVSTKDILGGGLKGALSLAAAGSLEVGEAAEISASAMTQFKLSGEDIPHIADLLAAGAGKAQGSVQDMGAALNQAGLVAGQTGLTIEETTGGLAAFASAGLTGSDAGTSFKTMLGALTPNSEAAAKAMDALGISAYDSQGNFIGLSEFAGKLQGSLSGLTDEQRNSTMETIFGSDAVRAAAVLYEQGAAGVQKWEDAVNDAGFAAETAAIKQDNLQGDFEKMMGSIDSVFLKSGSGANDVLRGLVQNAEDFVDAIGDIPTPVLEAGVGIASVAGGMALLGGAVLSALPRIQDGIAAFKDLEKAAPRAASAVKGAAIAGGIISIGVALGKIAEVKIGDQIERSVGRTTESLIDMAKQRGNIEQTTAALDHLFKTKDGGQLVEGVDNLDSALSRMFKKDFLQSANDWGNDMAKSLSLGAIDFGTMKTLEDSFKTIDDQLASFVSSGNGELAADSFSKIEEAARSQGIGIEQLKTAFPGYFEALKQADADAQLAAQGIEKITTATGQVIPITPEVQDALDEIGVSAAGAATDLEKFTAALFAAGLSTMSAREAEAAHEAAIDATKGAVEAATKAIEDQLVAQGYGEEAAKALAKEQMGLGAALNKSKTDFDRTTDAGRILNAQFQSVAQTGMAEIEAKAKAGAGQPELQKNLVDTFNALKQTGTGMGLTGGAADTLARKVMGIPPKANINTWMSDSAKRMAQETSAAVDAVNGKTANIYITTHRAEIITSTRSDSVQNSGGGKTKGPQAFAVGGAIVGPGTGTSDDILALLSNGEHVLTAEEVAKMGGQAAVYRFRELLDKGALPKFASGGEVGHLGESANARTNRLHREAQARAKARAAAEKKRREELRRTAQYRIDQMNDLRLDYARGESFRTVDDSLSSAYSFSDRLRSVAASGNVPRSAGALNQRANWSDQQMRSLHAQSEKLTKSLETAKSRLQDLTQVRNGIRDNLAGGFNIGDAVKRGNMYGSAKMSDIQGSAAGYLSLVQAFAGKLKRLQQMGYTGAIVQEIAEMGLVEGAKAADVLLTGTKADVKSLNKTKTAIDQASTSAGNAVTDALSKGGIQAADAFVKRLEQQQGAISKTMLSVGLAMENALRVALGSKAIRRAGGGAVHGPGSGTSDDVPALLSNGEHVFTAEEVRRMGGHAAVQRFRQGLAGGYRYAPAAAPRLNMPAPQAPGGRAGQTFGDVHISQQSDPVATFQEFSRRTRMLST
jgi:TP901 family phage tail tape measure protein